MHPRVFNIDKHASQHIVDATLMITYPNIVDTIRRILPRTGFSELLYHQLTEDDQPLFSDISPTIITNQLTSDGKSQGTTRNAA